MEPVGFVVQVVTAVNVEHLPEVPRVDDSSRGLLEPWNPRNEDTLTHLRTLLAVDEGVGALLEALESVEQLDNTLVIFTSDNGFLLGAHRLHDKRTMHEESIRVPLVMRCPKLLGPGSEISQLASTLDLAPTLLELAGLAVPSTMQGASLLPLLKGEAETWRSAIFYEYFQERDRGPGVPTILGVRTERWKYVHYPELPDDIDELYDLENDPYEMRNLIADPAYAEVLMEMQGALQGQLAATEYPQGELKYASGWRGNASAGAPSVLEPPFLRVTPS